MTAARRLRTSRLITAALLAGLFLTGCQGTDGAGTGPVADAVRPAAAAGTVETRVEACLKVVDFERHDCVIDAVAGLHLALPAVPGALDRLAAALAATPELSAMSCHRVLLDVGRRIAAEHGAAAVDHGSAVCTGGYYQGVLLADGDLHAGLLACATLGTEVARGDCAHGVGHAVWARTRDFAALTVHCSGPNATACLAGAFMQIADDSGHDPSTLNACDTPSLVDGALDACYTGLLTDVALADPTAALDWCAARARTPARLPEHCDHHAGKGVGLRVDADVPGDDTAATAAARQWCRERTFCLDGAARILGGVRNRAAAEQDLCAQVIAQAAREPGRPPLYCGAPGIDDLAPGDSPQA